MVKIIDTLLGRSSSNADEDYMELASSYLEQIHAQHPTNGKCQKLMALYRSLKFKHRIQEKA